MVKKKILLTGASGTVGKEIFKELLSRINKYEVSLFLRESPKNKKLFKHFVDKVKIFWGTLQNLKFSGVLCRTSQMLKKLSMVKM